LMERGGMGRTPCFTPVKFDAPYGSFLPLTITGRSGALLVGAPL